MRSRRDSVLGGVCGGPARYLGVDPLLLRVAAAASGHPTVAAAIGLAFGLLGAAPLLRELGLMTIRWSVVVPLVVLVVGVLLLVSGLAGVHRTADPPHPSRGAQGPPSAGRTGLLRRRR